MGLVKTSILLLILGVVCRHVYHLGMKMGYHKMVYSHSPGACYLVPGMVNGSEDIQRLSNGLAIISSGLKYSPAHSKREGALYLFDFNKPNEGVTRLAFTGVTLESPHGLGVWEEPDDGEVTVFVTDHASERDCVHKFKFDKSKRIVTYIKSIIDQTFIQLSGIHPTGPNSFYATNSFDSRNKMMCVAQYHLLLNRGNVVYYDGQAGHIVADNLGFANGINMSPDGRFLYVSSTMNEAIYIFDLMLDHKLMLKQEFLLYTSPDNIQVDKDTGDLWIAAIPMMHQLLPHLEDPELPAASQVLKLTMKEGNVESMEEVFADDGKHLFIASVAVRHKNTVLIGTAYHKLMHCKLQYLDERSQEL